MREDAAEARRTGAMRSQQKGCEIAGFVLVLLRRIERPTY